MSEPIRLIAMDMDGTLLAGDTWRIPPENARALRLAAARGIRLALCSGRLPDDAGFFALDAGLFFETIGGVFGKAKKMAEEKKEAPHA